MKEDKYFMRKALAEAQKAFEKGEVPVGAVVVSEEKVIACGHNQSLKKNDPTAHAEIIAIRKACHKRKNYRLMSCDLYVTLELCAMCAGAVVQARIRRLIYGAADPKAGAIESIMKFPFERTNHRPEVLGGVLADECSEILKDFFRKRRSKK
jgi:tRNA(adenine34) deaminase